MAAAIASCRLSARPERTAFAKGGGEQQNPYSLRFQAKVAIALCQQLGITRVFIAGHADGELCTHSPWGGLWEAPSPPAEAAAPQGAPWLCCVPPCWELRMRPRCLRPLLRPRLPQQCPGRRQLASTDGLR